MGKRLYKTVNTRLANLSMYNDFKDRFVRILDKIKKDIYGKSEVDILLKKEEEKIVELNALQVQIYGRMLFKTTKMGKKIVQ